MSTKARLWSFVHTFLQAGVNRYDSGHLGGLQLSLASSVWVRYEHRLSDEFKSHINYVVPAWKKYFRIESGYADTLDFVQWIIRNGAKEIAKPVAHILADERCAYRLIEATIVPIASEQEGKAVFSALETAKTHGMSGAHTHILDAATALTRGDFAESARESISAVESVVLTKTGETNFAKGLAKMDQANPMNGAFKIALSRLYDYTSQEPGVRHAKRHEGVAAVSERDAIFMMATCAAFVTYVLSPP